jgi:pilus assembly protein CpaB
MNRKIVLLFAGILALLAVVLMQLWKSNVAKELGVAGERVQILAAKDDVPAYSVIDSSQLTVLEYPKTYLPPRYMPKSLKDDVVGQTAMFSIKKGQPILTTDLASTQSEAQLSRVITPGMRALALPVDKVNSFGGLLRPKDHVDILGTFQKPGEGDVETITLLQNVAVLAVGGRLGSGRDAAEGAGKKGQPSADSRVNTVTVLVTPEEAELLVFAQDRGRISMTMRNEEDVNTEMELSGKNFADIFRPEVRQRIQKVRNDNPVSTITITTPTTKGGKKQR